MRRPLLPLFLLLLAFPLSSLFLSGCVGPIPKIPFKMPFKMGKNRPRISWKETAFPLRTEGATKIRIKSHEDLSGTIRLYTELIDGYDFGCLDWLENDGSKTTFQKVWQSSLVDASAIRWPNGESWGVFVWDTGNTSWLRTITLFEPRRKELYHCELEFEKGPDKELTGTVLYRFSWKLGLPENQKYRQFLDFIKFGYADAASLSSETRGLKNLRARRIASATFQPDRELPLGETLSKLRE